MKIAPRPRYALVLPGDAFWGAFQSGFTLELATRLSQSGHGTRPYFAATGSSSGSMIAAFAASGTTINHEDLRDLWVEFAQISRRVADKPRVLGPYLNKRALNPFADALRAIFDCGIVDFDEAYASETALMVAATHIDTAKSLGLGASLLKQGLATLTQGPRPMAAQDLGRRVLSTMSYGAQIVCPHYFFNHWPSVAPDDATPVKNGAELRRAIEASARIPAMYGRRVEIEGKKYIDGVFSDNAPIEAALASGASHIYIVNSSRKGNIFKQPVQSLVKRAVARRLGSFEMKSGSTDLNYLRELFSGRHIEIIHPDANAPVVNRFFETRADVLRTIYDQGREAATRVDIVPHTTSVSLRSPGLEREEHDLVVNG